MKNYKGLSNHEVITSREKHGRNVVTPPPETPWWKLFLEKFKDPIIVILLVATGISLVVGFIENSFIESIGIIIAIGLATGVGFYMEYSAKKKFDILNQVSNTEPVKVIRSGSVIEVPKDELVVGDIVILSTGDEIPADINLLESQELKVDESTMTGESVAASKKSIDDFGGANYTGSGFAPYTVLRSTKITEGSGVGEVIKVGDATEIGKTTRQAMEETEIETPLNKQLNRLASLINKAAFTMAGILLILLNVNHFFVQDSVDLSFMGILLSEVKFFMMAVTLVIVSVPEGMPLASTLSLAFSMKTMARENNLVKKMHACETIGAVNVIFSDKTGTLTQNKMTVVDVSKSGDENHMNLNICVNSTANLGSTGEILGNPTEGAMLNYLKGQGIDYKDIRLVTKVVNQKPFNSTDKYMSTIVKLNDGSELVLVKGAPEVVSGLCKNDSYLGEVSGQQDRGRRAISFAAGPDMNSLEYNGTCYIEDPVRSDVPDAVKKCYEAGIDVVMMTGDNIKTAAEIARQAGFSRKLQGDTTEQVWAIEAKDFDSVAWGDPNCGYPNVIARCKPEDKLHILKQMQGTDKTSHVCAMTGDGRFMPHTIVI